VSMLACACGVLVSCGGSGGTSHTIGGAHQASVSAPFRFFSPSSFWNKPLAADAPLDPSSPALIAAFDAQIETEEHTNNGPWINTVKSGIPVYTVPADQRTVPVRLAHHTPEPALSEAWDAVPLPSDAKPATGRDGSLAVWQPSTDRLWEFHRLVHSVNGWSAVWGGAMRDVSSQSGVYQYGVWPGAKPWWGISASSLSLVGGLISIEDVERGEINHALEMSLPERSGTFYATPARRTDGTSMNPLALPEGAHLRLNPNLDLSALHLPKSTLILAEAAQRYGIFITDGTGTSGVSTFFAQDPTPTGTNPYVGADGFFEGVSPRQLLAAFPWDQLQVLKLERHRGRSLAERARTRARENL
jgi:hypothetical protein